MKICRDRSWAVGFVVVVALVAVGCSTAPTAPTAPAAPKVVEAGGTHSCAIDANRQVACARGAAEREVRRTADAHRSITVSAGNDGIRLIRPNPQ